MHFIHNGNMAVHRPIKQPVRKKPRRPNRRKFRVGGLESNKVATQDTYAKALKRPTSSNRKSWRIERSMVAKFKREKK